ncbi:MAG: Toxin CcdB [Rhodocyclaceae bacterium]|nr:CcdB family protein [Zoogloeaceae bacterium]MBV6406941.1 Toxin CcdB [Rhodocyclaceae bacterium]MCK6384140.1 CcdB family protein [Rhodocyclaceae bacterium]
MAQFAVHRNPNPQSKARVPFLLDVQSDLLADLGTRVVVPLCPASAMKGKLVKTLMPTFQIDGKAYAMLTPQLAGIERKQMGAEVADLSARRAEIIAALDLLLTGI